MRTYTFHLDLSAEQLLAIYQGSARQVRVQGRDGSSLQFPAVLLRPFVTPAGVQGDFVLTCGDDFRGARLARQG